MTDETDAVEGVRASLQAARAEPADRSWGDLALLTMTEERVRTAVAVQKLVEVAETVKDAQQSPEELYGDPHEWAYERVAQLREQGNVAFDAPELMTGRDWLLRTLLGGFIFSLCLTAFFVVDRLRGEAMPQASVGAILLPGLIVGLIMTVGFVLDRLNARRKGWVTLVLCLLVALGACAGIASLLKYLSENGPRWSAGWLFAIPLLYFCLWYAGSCVWKAPQQAAECDTTMGDNAWGAYADKVLRARSDIDVARRENILLEARAFAEERGRSLAQEFGDPVAFAESIPGDPRVSARRGAVLACLLCASVTTVAAVGFVEEGLVLSWRTTLYPLLVLGFGWAAVSKVREMRKLNGQRAGA